MNKIDIDTVVRATPIGFNIKERDVIYFGGHIINAPFPGNIKDDIQENPWRWQVEYAPNIKTKVVDVKTSDVDPPPELQLNMPNVKKTRKRRTKR